MREGRGGGREMKSELSGSVAGKMVRERGWIGFVNGGDFGRIDSFQNLDWEMGSCLALGYFTLVAVLDDFKLH